MDEDKHNYGKILQLIQLVVIAAGVAGFFVDIGKRSSMLDKNTDDLTELKTIVQDLVKAQIQVASTDARHSALLEDLRQRVIELERRK